MNFKPTAGEMANIWQFIISNQAQLCLLEHWIVHAEDKDLQKMLQQSKHAANSIIQQGLELYLKAGFPKPIGFSLDKDVHLDAPRLMSDKLILISLQILSEYGVYGYGLTYGKTTTPEVLSYFETCINYSIDLYKNYTKILKKRGYEHNPVYIPVPTEAEMVNNQSFLAGWWGEQRPVTALEIDSLIFGLRGVILAKTFFMVFSQIAGDTKVKKFCERGKQLTGKRVEKIQSLNTSENLPFQATHETEITDSTISPFSDKLIMFESLALSQIAIARYGNALSSVVRRDLSTMFAFYIVETGTFLDDGLEIMIEKQWLEQPPLAANKK